VTNGDVRIDFQSVEELFDCVFVCVAFLFSVDDTLVRKAFYIGIGMIFTYMQTTELMSLFQSVRQSFSDLTLTRKTL